MIRSKSMIAILLMAATTFAIAGCYGGDGNDHWYHHHHHHHDHAPAIGPHDGHE